MQDILYTTSVKGHMMPKRDMAQSLRTTVLEGGKEPHVAGVS